MKSHRKNFPSLSKSKLKIIQALIQLLNKYDFEKITFLQIAQESDLSRATVYNHFKTKEDILSCYIHYLKSDFEKTLPNATNLSIHNFSLAVFSHWQKHKSFIEILLQNRLFMFLLDEFIYFFHDITLETEPEKIFSGQFCDDQNTRNYYREFVASGLWMMLKSWSENGMQETPLKMAENFEMFVRKD